MSEITVKDILKNAGAGAVLSDTSDLKDIENTKGDETFSQDGTAVKWNAGKEDIQYQGTADKELPVGVEFTYTLDGKAVSPEELAGKSGKVTIHVTYHNDAKTVKTIQGKKETLYTPFLMVTGIVLPKDVFSEVKIDHGKVLEEGDSQVVVGYGLPGLVKSLALGDEDISEDLVEEFARSFASQNKLINRARMAMVMGNVPVFFNSQQEISDYLNYALEHCNNNSELKAVIAIIDEMMEEE